MAQNSLHLPIIETLIIIMLCKQDVAFTAMYEPDVYLPLDVIESGFIIGQKYDGLLVGSPRTVPGVFGNALELNISPDVNQYVNLGNLRNSCFGNVDLCSDGSTLSLWVKLFTQRSERTYIVANGAQTTYSYGFYLILRKGTLFTRYTKQAGESWEASYSDLSYGTWTHVGVSWSTSTGIQLYVDGELVSSDNSPSPEQTNTMFKDVIIGAPSNALDWHHTYCSMLIDDIRFWNKKLENPSDKLWNMYAEGLLYLSATPFVYQSTRLSPFARYQPDTNSSCVSIQPEEPYSRSAIFEVSTSNATLGLDNFTVQVKGGYNMEYVDVSVVTSSCKSLTRCRQTTQSYSGTELIAEFSCYCSNKDCDVIYLDLRRAIHHCTNDLITCLPINICGVAIVRIQ